MVFSPCNSSRPYIIMYSISRPSVVPREETEHKNQLALYLLSQIARILVRTYGKYLGIIYYPKANANAKKNGYLDTHLDIYVFPTSRLVQVYRVCT